MSNTVRIEILNNNCSHISKLEFLKFIFILDMSFVNNIITYLLTLQFVMWVPLQVQLAWPKLGRFVMLDTTIYNLIKLFYFLKIDFRKVDN